MGRWAKFIMCAGRGCLGNPGGGPGGTIAVGGAGVLTGGPSSGLSSGFYERKVVSVSFFKDLN